MKIYSKKKTTGGILAPPLARIGLNKTTRAISSKNISCEKCVELTGNYCFILCFNLRFASREGINSR